MKKLIFLIFLLMCKEVYCQEITQLQKQIDSLKAIKIGYEDKIKVLDFLIKQKEDKKIISEFESFESIKYIVPAQPVIRIRDKDNSSGNILFEPKKGDIIELLDFNDYFGQCVQRFRSKVYNPKRD